jgi:histidine triad (HIT) family protein
VLVGSDDDGARGLRRRRLSRLHCLIARTALIDGATHMADTIFGKILRGEIPCHKVYEDEHVLAFLDVGPLSKGHTLVIPKEPAVTLDALSDEASAAIGRVLPRLCRAVKKVTGCEAYNVLQNNGPLAHQAVFHVHFHIIPKPDAEQGLGVRWPSTKLDAEAGKALAQQLRDALK